METMSLSQMMRISIAMPILFVLSVVVAGQALERFYVFWVAQRLPEDLFNRVRHYMKNKDKGAALVLCGQSAGVMSHAFVRILSLPYWSTEKVVETFQLYRQKLHMDLSRRLGLFGTVSFIAPLIGLMGTVLGIMRAFHDLASAGAGGPTVVAAGISEALVATAAGIGLAVMSAVFYNYFTLTVRSRMSTVDLWVFELAQILEELQAKASDGDTLRQI
ncbi:MAG: MotA/TolQ/ExbB proton channel family protein [Elusimicrobiota bacterium]